MRTHIKTAIKTRELAHPFMVLLIWIFSQTQAVAEELRLKRLQTLPQAATPVANAPPATAPAPLSSPAPLVIQAPLAIPEVATRVQMPSATLPAPIDTKSLNPQPVPPLESGAKLPQTGIKPITSPAIGNMAPLPTTKPLSEMSPVNSPASTLSTNKPGIAPPALIPMGANAEKTKGDVLPLNNAEQLKSYANLPDSQVVQLPKSENNARMTLGEVRKKLQTSETAAKTGSFADTPYSSARKTKDTAGVDAMYAAARAAGVADRAAALSKAIKINGQASPSVWDLAWNKPYFIESSDFKAPAAVKLQLLKQNKSFDLPILQGSSRAGSVAFSIPSSVIGVYEQPAQIVLTDSDGATYTTQASTFYPHIVTKNFAQIPVKITPWGSSSNVKLDSTGFSFEEEVVSDNPSYSGTAATYMVYIENLSPHWIIESFAADVIAYPLTACDTFFANQSNSGPNSTHLYYAPASADAISRSNPSKGMKVAVLPTRHCKSVYYTQKNKHLFKGKTVIHIDASGPDGLPITVSGDKPDLN